MTFAIAGLDPRPFVPFFGADQSALKRAGIVRRRADKQPGYPCRVTLEDAAPGETLLLLNFESHAVDTPYRSSYAIYVREGAHKPAHFVDEIPPVMRARPLAFRHFDKNGMLVGASLALKGDARDAIVDAFDAEEVAYLHAHNAAHGCFAAAVRRA